MKNLGYFRPDSLSEALAYLSQSKGRATIIAGGTDVMVDLRSGELRPETLVDVSRLDELKGIHLEKEELIVGAGVTLSEIYDSSILAEWAPSLQKASFNFASKQIRNVATIGGNVAHCSPCGDTIPPLVIHEAEAVVASLKGVQRVPIQEVATGAYRCFLNTDEIITSFILKPRKTTFADFQKIGRRNDLAISRLSLAAMIDKDEDGAISMARISLGACTPTPHRMEPVEDFLVGEKPTEKLLFEAGRLLADKMIEITGRRSSIVYKEPAIQGLLVRLLLPVV